MQLCKTQAHSCHPRPTLFGRIGGDLELQTITVVLDKIPACAGMTNERLSSVKLFSGNGII